MKKIINYLIVSTFLCAGFLATSYAGDLAKTPEQASPVLPKEVSGGKVFGQWLFEGNFAEQAFNGFNPDYLISSGDKLLIQIWGGLELNQEVEVDAQGNIFIPKVGPVQVLGIANKELNKLVLKSIQRIYTANVGVYASLVASQPVKVFVTGYVNKPGLYTGVAGDSLLRFIDKAKGINPKSGSYTNVQVLRGDKTITTISLYDFLINGTMPLIQLQDGDRILVAPLGKQVSISGNVANPYLFEIKDGQTLKELLAYAQPGPNVTHVRIDSRNNGQGSSVVYPLADVVDQALHAGDDITVVSDIKPTTIAVSIAGEFSGSQELILPWGANLQDALDKIQYTDLSNKQAINLYRKSVQQRQKAMLDASLNSLEQSVLNARSATNETANLRKTEAEVVLQWVAKAKEVMPRGQVIITNKNEMQKLILEHGDTIVIPRKNTLVLVHGDVMFPNAVTYEKGYEVQDYIASAGGFSQDPDNAVVVILKPDGKYERLASGDLNEEKAEQGDEIFVLPQVDMKSLQVTKDITQILYQIAVSAGVVLAL